MYFVVLQYAYSQKMLFDIQTFSLIMLGLLLVSLVLGKSLFKSGARLLVPLLLIGVSMTLLSLVDNSLNASIFLTLSAGLYYVLYLSLYRLKAPSGDTTAQS